MILVTGGAGFIGKNLVLSLSTKHRAVTVVDKAPRPKDFQSSTGVSYQRGDAYRIGTLLPARRQSNLKIVHLAAETSVHDTVLRPQSSVRTNVGVTCALLEFARRMDVDSFVFASSAAVYGDKKGACGEDDFPDPLSQYAASKLAGEYYCNAYSKLYGIPITILRYFNVYGPGQSERYAGVITDFLRTILDGKPPTIYGDGRQTRDFIFVEDVVQATLRALEQNLPGCTTLNIGTGHVTSIRSLALKTLALLGRLNLHPVYVPSRKGDVRFSRANISRARKMIGFRPKYSLDEGLKHTLEWIARSHPHDKSQLFVTNR